VCQPGPETAGIQKAVKRSIEAVKIQIRRRRFIIAIDETYEAFYGKIKNLLICDI